jgi:hypothetical protein
MTKIKTYAIKKPVVSGDKWIGSSAVTGITKNFDSDGIKDYVLEGISPEIGGTIKVTEIEVPSLDTDISTTINSLDPSYNVLAYEIVFFMIEGVVYVLKLADITIGIGGTELTNDDFITFPINTGATGNGIASIVLLSTSGLVKTYRITYTNASTFDFTVTDGSNGDDGDDGTNGLNADMTRTSTTSISIASGVSRTLNYTTSANLGWLVGTRLRFANSGTNYMEGVVTSVSSTSVTILVDNAVGSGTYASWNISIAGDMGALTSLFPARVTDSSTDETYTTKNSNFTYNIQLLKSPRTVIIVGSAVNTTGGTLPIGTKIFDIKTGTFRGTTSAFYGVNCTHEPHEIRTTATVASGATLNFQIEYFAENF